MPGLLHDEPMDEFHSELRDALRTLALATARTAADMVHTHLSGAYTVDTKSSALDLVTEIDRASEELITSLLLTARPHDGVIGEEGTGIVGTSDIAWSIDPIDGTTSFVYGLPGFSVSIAARYHGEVVAGAVVAPAIGTEFHAALGQGATVAQKPGACRATSELSHALVATGFSPDTARRQRQAFVVAGLLPEIRDIRRMGSAALDLASVAAGQLDAYYEDGLNPWDYDAGALLASEAGAKVIVRPDPTTGRSWVFAAAPGIAEQLLAKLTDLDHVPA